MGTNEIKVARNYYHTLSVTLLANFGLGVRTNVFITNPTLFPTPPMTQVAFEAIIEDFELKRSLYVNGGEDQRGPYEDALTALMAALDEFADMVDGIPNLTTAIVNQGGFVATKETDTEHHVPDGGKGVVNLRRGGSTGVVEAECNVVPEAEYYHCIVTNAPMPELRIVNDDYLEYDKTGTFFRIHQTKTRKKTFQGLTAGVVYYVYYWAGNAKGVSQVFEVKSIMSA
jgi:hypothetical protein